jgi:hypothetical protein
MNPIEKSKIGKNRKLRCRLEKKQVSVYNYQLERVRKNQNHIVQTCKRHARVRKNRNQPVRKRREEERSLRERKRRGEALLASQAGSKYSHLAFPWDIHPVRITASGYDLQVK